MDQQQTGPGRGPEGVETIRPMFEGIQTVANGELKLAVEDLKLLEIMNDAVTRKYDEMSSHAAIVKDNIRTMKDRYADFEPQLMKLDLIDSAVSDLEKVAAVLEESVKSLEMRLKS